MDRPRPPRGKIASRRIATVLAGLLFAIAAGGFATQRWKDAHLPPAPGRFASAMDGPRLHYRLSGNGEYTFVLEPGLGDYSASWGELEPALARVGRVFVYDRAGLGWSEAGEAPRSPEQIATELHDLLSAAAIPKPYILVGHSLGGLTQTLFALRFPEDVAGLLLIDPTHLHQADALPPPPKAMMFLMTQFSRAAPLGLPQLLMRSPDPIASSAKHVRTSGAELRGLLAALEEERNRPIDLGRLPIYVLTAGALPPIPDQTEAQRKAIWTALHGLHAQLVHASSSPIRRHETVAHASHYIHRSQPEVVANAARELTAQLTAAAKTSAGQR